MAVTDLGGGGGGAGLGGGKWADDLSGACGERSFDCGGHAIALRGAGEDEDDGCAVAQQDAQHVAFDWGVEAAEHRRTIRSARIGPILRFQDDVAGAGLRAEDGGKGNPD